MGNNRLRIRRSPREVLPPPPLPPLYGVAYSVYLQGYIVFQKTDEHSWVIVMPRITYPDLEKAKASCSGEVISLPFNFLNAGANPDR